LSKGGIISLFGKKGPREILINAQIIKGAWEETSPVYLLNSTKHKRAHPCFILDAGAFSNPADDVDAVGRMRRIASATFWAVNPPARIMRQVHGGGHLLNNIPIQGRSGSGRTRGGFGVNYQGGIRSGLIFSKPSPGL
jgi:hypothetical protein